MSVIQSFWRSLFPLVQVRKSGPAEPVEKENHGSQTKSVENGCTLQPIPQPGKNAKRNKARAEKKKRLARIARQAMRMTDGIVDKKVEFSYGPSAMVRQARELWELGFIASAGVSCRIALETHARNYCEALGILQPLGKRATLAEFMRALHHAGVFNHHEMSNSGDHLSVANRSAHGTATSWWEVASLISYTEVVLMSKPVPTAG